MAYSLAWQDTVVIAGSSPIVEWELQVEEEGTWRTVFNGKSWVSPDEDYVLLNVGRLMRDYLNPEQMPPESAVQPTRDDGSIATFRVVANDIVWDERTVRYDYSFEDSDWDGEDRTLSEPVNGHADSRMRIMTSYWRETEGTIEIVSQ